MPTSPSQPPQARDTALSQVPQEKPVKQGSGSHIEVDSGTSSQDKSSVPTSPSQSPQTRGTAPPQVQHSVPPSPSSLSSGAVPPPPPPPLAPNSNGTPLPKKANSSSMSEGKVNGGANQENPRDAVFAQIRKKVLI
ncbi:hypothetical protein [Wolbachia endosymbiont (group A) of Barypeithes pellucidus]|uniref:hypothetical protein n=1 Tax=Wolbachia endosymbiont (group A) of Barypeithes pellucidus TaxID=3139322 RepID=UPI003CCB26CC